MTNFTDNSTASPYGTRKSLHFKRSQFVLDAAGMRQQINSVTGLLDASVVYGSSAGGFVDVHNLRSRYSYRSCVMCSAAASLQQCQHAD
jgi:hypothetical protein